MIDEETKQKVINLYVDGESKKHIEEETGVSQPSIRKILREAFIELHKDKENISERIEDDEKVKRVEEDNIKLEARQRRENMRSIKIDQLWDPEYKGESDKIFILNLVRNHPMRGYSVMQRLRNGIPSWRTSAILREILPEYIVREIVSQINRLGGAGNVYQVNISPNNSQQVTVALIAEGNFPMKQPAE